MTHQDTDDATDVIDALRSELKRVPLSPEFAARLRQRIDGAPDARGAAWLSGWRWLVPVAAVASVVIAVVVVSRPRPAVPQEVTARATMETPPTVAPEPEHPSTREPENLRTRAPGNPSLEVITNQPAILRALWAHVEMGSPMIEVSAAVVRDTVPEIVVAPIEVSPIVVKPLDPQPAPGGVPIIR